METLTRAGLAEAVWRELGLSLVESERLVEAAIQELTAALAAGEEVRIVNLGSFVLRDKGARPGRKILPLAAQTPRGLNACFH